MKTDLRSLTKELKKLADTDYIKKELNRVAGEIKKFDVSATLTAEAQNKVEQLEKKFRELLVRLSDLQDQVDESLEKFVRLVRRGGTKTAKKAAKSSKKKASKVAKVAKKKTSRKKAKKA